jgi:flagellar biosynthesis protein FlhG
VFNSSAEFWVFVSGKGGVGKSVLALHMAKALTEHGKRVLLLDTDLGLANLHVLSNVQPNGRLEQVLSGSMKLQDAITSLDCGPDLLAADNGRNVTMLAGVDAAQELAETLGALNTQYDYILVDTPRGITDPSIQFCRACDKTLLVTSPEPTSITNTYAWYKIAHSNGVQIPTWLIANESDDPSLPSRFSDLCQRFLGHAPMWGGSIPHDPSLVQAVLMQRPLFDLCPDSSAWQAIKDITKNLQSVVQETVNQEPPPWIDDDRLYEEG